MPKPFEPEALNRRVADLIKQASGRHSGVSGAARADAGQVTVVLGLRGGVGATTTAITLAGALQRAGRRVCLVDLSPNGGHVTLHLRMPAPTTWANLPAALEPSGVAKLLVRHDSGLLVLAAPAQPVRAGPAVDAFRTTLEALQIFFTDIIVDAAPTLDDASWLALRAARRILMVCTPEVSSIHTAVGALNLLASVRPAEGEMHVALNHVAPDHNLPAAAVVKALGRPPDFLIPYDRQQPLALTTGTPLIYSQPGALLPAAIAAYAAQLTTAA
jgi:pilus assembly protein CpaE